ncbi:MAG TPA: TorF family putative porin [Gammaproteobacteria bacterium]|jgi:uncharacterized protein (TIGR02001 family)|nr:TorF family putative porin [Gammaproteobacteria bacterium]
MKKALALLSVCTMFTPSVFADSGSEPVKKDPSQTANAAASHSSASATDSSLTNDDAKYPWLKNLSGNLTFVTNYVFRGISQSSNLPATQGSLTYTFPINIYLNIWGSNVKFLDSHGKNATVELDTIIGYHNTYGDNFSYDLSFARYNYSGARFANYNEFNAVASYYFIQLTLGYSADVFNTHQTGTYYNGGINYDIPSTWIYGVCDVNFLATLGHYSLPVAAGNSYNDYNIQVTKGFKNYKVAAQWTSTNGRQHNSPLDGSQLIAQLGVDF